MAISTFKPKSEEYDLQSELDRKVLDTLEKLDFKYSTGQITEHQLGTAMQTLYQATFGLVQDESLETIMNAYVPVVVAPCAYLAKLSKGNSLIYVTWEPDQDEILITTAFTGEVKRIPIPDAQSAHSFYNKIISKLTDSGWSDFNDDSGINDDD